MTARVELTSSSDIQRLALRFRWSVSGSGSRPGLGGGRRLGSAGEFEGYRNFEPGDDLRSMDLKVYARLRRRVVRVLREDTAVPVTLLVDRSASMLDSKRQRATIELAEFFAAVASHRGDSLRVFTFADELEPVQPAGPLRAAIQQRAIGGNSDYGAALRSLPADPAGRGIVIVLSDGFGLEEPDRELAPLRRVGLPFWIAPLAASERDPHFDGPVELVPRELEPLWRGTVDEETLRDYRAQLARYHEALTRRLHGWGGDFVVVHAEDALLPQVTTVLRKGTLIRC